MQESLHDNLLAKAAFFDPAKSDMQTRVFDLTKHDGRVAMSKLVIWATAHRVELRISPV